LHCISPNHNKKVMKPLQSGLGPWADPYGLKKEKGHGLMNLKPIRPTKTQPGPCRLAVGSSSFVLSCSADPSIPIRLHRPAPPPPWPPPPPQSFPRRVRLPSSNPPPTPPSFPSRGGRCPPPPSPSPPPPSCRWCRRPTPSTTTRRWTRATRTWTGRSSCGGSTGRCPARASWRRSGGGAGTRRP